MCIRCMFLFLDRGAARWLVREKQVRGKCMPPPPPVVIRCRTAHLFSDAGLVRPVALFEHNLSLQHALRAGKHTCVSCSVGWHINNILQKKNGKMSIKSTLKVTPLRSLFFPAATKQPPHSLNSKSKQANAKYGTIKTAFYCVCVFFPPS